MSKKAVQYSYALNEKGEPIGINEAKDHEGKYYCPHCHAEMIKRCGENNAWHFAHHMQDACKYDKYLHSIAEIRIQDWINSTSEFTIRLGHIECCKRYKQCVFYDNYCKNVEPKFKDHNLKKWYGNCVREKQVKIGEHTFVADLLWYNKTSEKDTIFIEINVSHPCDNIKINSGVRIIEIDINSENDIDDVINNPTKNKLIRLYNFKPQEIPSFENPPKQLHRFILYDSMKGYVDYRVLCHEIDDPEFIELNDDNRFHFVDQRRGIFEITLHNEENHYFHDEGGLYNIGYAVASQYFPSLKDCRLCIHQEKFSPIDTHVICSLRKKQGTFFLTCKDVYKCANYQRADELIKQRIEVFEKFKKKYPVDIWFRNKG